MTPLARGPSPCICSVAATANELSGVSAICSPTHEGGFVDDPLGHEAAGGSDPGQAGTGSRRRVAGGERNRTSSTLSVGLAGPLLSLGQWPAFPMDGSGLRQSWMCTTGTRSARPAVREMAAGVVPIGGEQPAPAA